MYIPQEVYKLMELDPEFKDKFSKQLKETTSKSKEMVDKINHPETSDVPMIEPFIFEQYKTNYRTKNLNIDGNVLLGSESSESTLFIPPEVTEIAEMSFKSEEPFKEDDIGKSFHVILHPTGLKKIGKEAFEKSHLYSLDVKDPEMFAYYGGRGGHFYQIFKNLILFPETLEEIGEDAFALCENFADGCYMILPQNLKKVSRRAFFFCSSLAGVYFNGAKEVSEDCFHCCQSLKNVVLDDCVETIQECAFSACFKLTKIVFSSNLKKIDDYAFHLCNLKTIILPKKLEYIGKNCFASCRKLVEVDMPDSLCVIGDGAFNGCTQLRKLRLSNSLSVIPQECFNGCKWLEDVVIPENVSSIEHHAFRNCKSLVSIIIPESVTSIDKFAFRGCNQLVIYGTRGSYAEQFAKEHNIKFDIVENKVVVPTICESCGTKLKKDDKFCHECGAKIVAKPFVSIE